MNACEICGSTEDLYLYDDDQGREIWACRTGDCGQELQRIERDEAEEAFERDLEAIRRDHGF